MLPDETCWFLAADFDKESWQHDVAAFLTTCRYKSVPATLERSRSGNGVHVWIFFSEPVSATLARTLGAHILTETMEQNPDIGFESYDRFFPNQDTMPIGGFGNLIALPLQHRPRQAGNSLFLDDDFQPHADQWHYLSSIRRMSLSEVSALTEEAGRLGRILGVRLPTFAIPRIIGCAELLSHHIALPRGCRDQVDELFASLGINIRLKDERNSGHPVETTFIGELEHY